jgi:hypothetical protein
MVRIRYGITNLLFVRLRSCRSLLQPLKGDLRRVSARERQVRRTRIGRLSRARRSVADLVEPLFSNRNNCEITFASSYKKDWLAEGSTDMRLVAYFAETQDVSHHASTSQLT